MARVFISYASQDGQVARGLLNSLRPQHVVFLAEELIHAGEDWGHRLNEELHDADAVVCLVTPKFIASMWCISEVAVARTLGKRLIPLAAGADPTIVPMLERIQYIDYAADRSSAVRKVQGQLQALDMAGVRPPPGAWRSPFPGLAPFDQDRAWAFCGRREETTELAELMRSPAVAAAGELVVVVGPPGCGKSSLVRAGLLPMLLNEPGRWALPPVVPGGDPLNALANAFADAGVKLGLPWTPKEVAARLALAASASARGSADSDDPGDSRDPTEAGGRENSGGENSGRENDGGENDGRDHHDEESGDPSAVDGTQDARRLVAEILSAAPEGCRDQLLIVLDQFEGVLTQTTPMKRAQFAVLLKAMTACPVRIVATLRSEFVPALQESTRLRGLSLNLFTLRPVGSDTLREIIIEPARRARISIDPSLVDVLVRETPDGNALPLLAYTLGQLARGVRAGGALSKERYDAMGGVVGALVGRADSALSTRVVAGRQPEEVLASLLQLVTFDRDGRPVGRTVDRSALSGEVNADLDAFVERRLLTTLIEDGRVEIAVRHQHFLAAWPPLREKIEKEREVSREREALGAAAREWAAAGRPRTHLWDRGRVAEATRPSPSGTLRQLSEVERQFVAGSHRHRGFGQRPVITGLVISLVVLLALAGFAGYQWSVARDGKVGAVRRELLALADSLRDSNPQLAIQVALAADSIGGGEDTRRRLNETLVSTGHLGQLQHEGAQRTVAFSPDGATVAFGGESGHVVLADPPRARQEGRIRRVFEEHAGAVNAVTFAPDGRLLATAGDDGKVVLWDLDTPEDPGLDEVLLDLQVPVKSVVFAPNGRTLAAAADDGRVLLWDLSGTPRPAEPTVVEPTVVEQRAASATAVTFAPGGDILAVGGADGAVRLWNTADPHQPGAYQELGGVGVSAVTSIAFRRDGGVLAVADADGTVRVWAVGAGGPPDVPVVLAPPDTEYAGAVTGLTYTSDGRLVTAGQKQAVLVRDASDPRTVLGSPISDRGSPALDVAVDQDGKTLAIASQNGGVLLWSLEPDGQPRSLGAPIRNAPAFDMTYVADGSALYAASRDNSVRIWDVTDPANPSRRNSRIDLSGFGEVLETTIAGAGCGGLDAATSRPAFRGCRFAIAGSTGRVRIFDIADLGNPRPLVDFTAHPGTPIHDMQLNREGDLLVTGADDGEVYLWDLTEGPRRIGPRLTGHTGAVRDVQFSETTSDLLATASDDGTVLLWDVADPRRPRRLAALDDPRGPVNDVTFSSDGQTLFAASDDGNVWRWDVREPQAPVLLGRPFADHRGPVYDLVNLGDHIIASSGEDRRVTFWDVSDAHDPHQLGPVITHPDAVIDMNLARDANRLATADAGQTVRLWDVSPLLDPVPADVVEIACARAGGGLSENDWRLYVPTLPYRPTC